MQYDPFAVQKATAFTKSLGSVEEVAASTLRLVTAAEQAGSDEGVARQGLFEAMQVRAWGLRASVMLSCVCQCVEHCQQRQRAAMGTCTMKDSASPKSLGSVEEVAAPL